MDITSNTFYKCTVTFQTHCISTTKFTCHWIPVTTSRPCRLYSIWPMQSPQVFLHLHTPKPFQSNFSATRILPALIYFGLERGWWITCPYYIRKSVRQAPTAERENKRNKKMCRTSSDIGAEQENHNVGRGPTLDRKGLSAALTQYE
jgi:hypothetical protein